MTEKGNCELPLWEPGVTGQGTAVTKAPAGGLRRGAFAAAQIFFAIVAAVCHPSLASASAALGIVAESKSVSPPIIENIVVIDVPVQKEFSIGRVGADSRRNSSGVDNLNYALPICVLQSQQEFLGGSPISVRTSLRH